MGVQEIQEKSLIIQNNTDKVRKAGKLSTLKDSKYMHPTLSGSVIAVNDVNGMEHNLGVKVTSKNLFNFPIISVNRNKWDNGYAWQSFDSAKVDISHLKGQTITYQCKVDLTNIDENNTSIYVNSNGECTLYGCVMLWFYRTDNSVITTVGGNNIIGVGNIGISKITAVVPDEENVLAVFGIRSSFYGYNTTEALGEDYIELSNPMVELGSTATPYTPYITDFSGIEVSRLGKNLLDISKPNISYINTSALGYPLTIIEEEIYSGGRDGYSEGGSIHISNPRVPISISFDVSGDFDNPINRCSVRHFDNLDEQNIQINSVRIMAYPMTTKHIKIENIRTDKNFISVAWFGAKEKSLVISNLQIECGSVATNYEPYQEQTAFATEDGSVNGLTSLSPNMMLVSDTEGVIINCEYYRDIDTYINNLTTNIALSGGE